MDAPAETRFQSVHPVLFAKDLQEALAYYRNKLGFRVSWTYGSPAFRAGVAFDSLELQLTDDAQQPPAVPANLYFHVTGVDAYYARCRERGATLSSELEDRPWGMRDFRVTDPTGNRLGFGEPVEARVD